MNKNKNLAFTLAEVLIVIGIIGVVAALTLPNLNHATGDKEKVTKVKKIYSSLTDAVDRAQAIYGPFDTWFNDIDNNVAACNERFAKRVTEFMKVSKDCGFGEGCFSNAPLLDSDGGEFFENYLEELQNANIYMVALADGTTIGFHSDAIAPNNIDAYSKFNIDIDGPLKGKNQIGNDIFDFDIYSNLETAVGDGKSINQVVWHGNNGDFMGNTTAWVIENGNLDYLKCPDVLNWETKTSCE